MCEWVPVEKQSPPVATSVTVTYRYRHGKSLVAHGWCTDGAGTWWTGDALRADDTIQVLAWAYPPEPYQPKEAEETTG